MLPLEVVATVAFGSLLGVRHAFEPDHLAAVSTLINEERSSYRAALLGAYWGVGHTTSLVAVGVGLVLLGAELPAHAHETFEVAVALMLIALGVRAIVIATRAGGCRRSDTGRDTAIAPSPPASGAHRHVHGWGLARRPLLFGIVHGLAGSGALTALVITALPSTATRLTYISLFGVGSTVAMAALSGLLGWPISQIGCQPSVARNLSLFVGIVSTGLGIAKAYPFVAQLF
jgi:high-affinity nickel-transport protein